MTAFPFRPLALAAACLAALAGCATTAQAPATPPRTYYGTLEPFASEAIYFVVTDRFVNGDPSNDFREQGGAHRTFDIPLPACDGVVANIGYQGGDFRGLLDHADYIREMGFSAVWITPIVANPDEAFTGGDPISCTSFLTDRGKAGYHGYWATNFYALDEHLPSPGLGFAELTAGLRAKGLKTVLDIVGNHGSPGWSMPTPQPGFGQLFGRDGELIADHQNLPPEQLDPAGNPLHAFYNGKKDLAQLADLNGDNPAVMDHLVGAYLQWAGQGADAFRIDTIRHQPLAFWNTFAARIREKHPGFYMFGEAFDAKAEKIAPFTWPEHGGIAVLDFPLKDALLTAFEKGGSYSAVAPTLYLEAGPYQNPYELTTFYDNHDMPRMQADDEGFIDAHNFLFTARGIPVIYYGSEMGFMRGRAEHAGNRQYFGVENVAAARGHRIRERLARIAGLRARTPALQRGLQLNLAFAEDTASFLRVLQHGGVNQTALVLLNKGDAPASLALPVDLPAGAWRPVLGEAPLLQPDGHTALAVSVPAHDVVVYLLEAPITGQRWLERLDALMRRPVQKPAGPVDTSPAG
jgi:cyclomaltodextrin glucanotransferase